MGGELKKDKTLQVPPASTELTLRPIGVVRSELKLSPGRDHDQPTKPKERITEIRAQHRKLQKLVSELIIDPAFEELLEGIEEFSHILVLYWPHLLPEENRKIRKVHPMRRMDLPEVGVFATRSQARPNPVLISTVRLLARRGNILEVQALDALDGSLIVDIKPYMEMTPEADQPRFPDWLRKLRKDLTE